MRSAAMIPTRTSVLVGKLGLLRPPSPMAACSYREIDVGLVDACRMTPPSPPGASASGGGGGGGARCRPGICRSRCRCRLRCVLAGDSGCVHFLVHDHRRIIGRRAGQVGFGLEGVPASRIVAAGSDSSCPVRHGTATCPIRAKIYRMIRLRRVSESGGGLVARQCPYDHPCSACSPSAAGLRSTSGI